MMLSLECQTFSNIFSQRQNAAGSQSLHIPQQQNAVGFQSLAGSGAQLVQGSKTVSRNFGCCLELCGLSGSTRRCLEFGRCLGLLRSLSSCLEPWVRGLRVHSCLEPWALGAVWCARSSSWKIRANERKLVIGTELRLYPLQ